MTRFEHLSESAEWFSPVDIVEGARSVMGGIDLDPASCEEANGRVRASRFFTKEQDGLKQAWAGRLWINPPGDKLGALPKAFWAKLCDEFIYGDVVEAIYLGFSLEQLVSLQDKSNNWTLGAEIRRPPPLHFPICVPCRRLAFVRADGSVASGNTHGSFISYLGWRAQRFVTIFERFGACRW